MDETRAEESVASGGRYSVVRLTNAWYVACRSRDLGRKPVARTVLDSPLVLFRDERGEAGALLDRCPHRNAPLSLGRIANGALECRYHGWRFATDGACLAVPGLAREGGGRSAEAFPTRERQGFVWVHLGDRPPAEEPPLFPKADDPAYATFRFEYRVRATLHAALENMLDVPHTGFLHRGLFRGARRRRIEAIVRRSETGVECEYVGEPPPTGLVARILARGETGTLEHTDRFFLPSTSQVEYRLGESHLLATASLTPVGDFDTRVFLVLCLRLPLPTWLLRPVLEPVLRTILRQDIGILRAQTDTIRRLGGERYTSTEIDLLGPHIWKLLRDAERGVSSSGEAEKRVSLEV